MKFLIADLKYSFRKFLDNLPLKIACKLPKKIQLWCFILVYGADGECPSKDYAEKYHYFVKKYNIKGF
jgi:hypothetical protein